jgi:predicted helicase
MPRPSAQISPAHPLIREYQRSLADLRDQGVENELGLRRPFENLLADNLKRELPRIPFAPDFAAFAAAGRELARLHIEYETLEPWPLESALEWVVDQYRVTEDERSGIKSDPNREDDPQYIVRLVGQVVRVGIETVRLVRSLSAVFPHIE